MKIGALRETFDGERRVALTPDSAQQLQKPGHQCLIVKGAVDKAGFTDQAYAEAGVTVLPDAQPLTQACDVLVEVRGPEADELEKMHEGQTTALAWRTRVSRSSSTLMA